MKYTKKQNAEKFFVSRNMNYDLTVLKLFVQTTSNSTYTNPDKIVQVLSCQKTLATLVESLFMKPFRISPLRVQAVIMIGLKLTSVVQG